LREERRLRVLRRIFGSKRDEVTGNSSKLHNDELNDLYPSPDTLRCDKIEETEMGRACSAYGGKERGIQGFGAET